MANLYHFNQQQQRKERKPLVRIAGTMQAVMVIDKIPLATTKPLMKRRKRTKTPDNFLVTVVGDIHKTPKSD
jgi:hypothetical protein